MKKILLKIATLNERVEEEAAARPDIVYFFGQGNLIFIREKSGNFERVCLWQPCYKSVTLAVEIRLC